MHTAGGDSLIKDKVIREVIANKGREIDFQNLIEKCERMESLELREVSRLLFADREERAVVRTLSKDLKRKLYGNRIVLFAPLYISDYCVNGCSYCGYSSSNKTERKKLSKEEIAEEVRALEKMGHKRLALEVGEDPLNCDIDYVISAIETIYETQSEFGEIRRLNVNIAGTTVENYRRLKNSSIGTYILFQETYDREIYEKQHRYGPKSDYDYHLASFERAMEAGIGDVGGGVLFGLSDYRYEVMGLFLHNDHLKKTYGTGFHTVSVPRIKKALGVDMSEYDNMVDDEDFKHIVSVLRLILPNAGIILSTRESMQMRAELLERGVSQISAGSATGVGGYSRREGDGESPSQFEIEDHRQPKEVVESLVESGYIPSYCTACYRKGRVGESFMELSSSHKMKEICTVNAILTLLEYSSDFGDAGFTNSAEKLIETEVKKLSEKSRAILSEKRKLIEAGKRDIYI